MEQRASPDDDYPWYVFRGRDRLVGLLECAQTGDEVLGVSAVVGMVGLDVGPSLRSPLLAVHQVSFLSIMGRGLRVPQAPACSVVHH
jgi:hypothetical protein